MYSTKKNLREYEEWQRKRDETISFLKSRRTPDGGIIADDFAIQQLRDIYLGHSPIMEEPKIETPSGYAKMGVIGIVACILGGAFVLL